MTPTDRVPSGTLTYCMLFQLDRGAFEYTLTELNNMYASAESLSGRTYCESCFACLTAYLAYVCIDTHYEKVGKSASLSRADVAFLQGVLRLIMTVVMLWSMTVIVAMDTTLE